MTFTHSSNAALRAPSFESLMETIDRPPLLSLVESDSAPGGGLIYRSSPDGSVTMGTDPRSGQVVLIVQYSAEDGGFVWEMALPPKIARFAAAETLNSLAAAKQMAEQAFGAWWASRSE